MLKANNPIRDTVLKNRFKKRHITDAMIDIVSSKCNMVQLFIWWDEDKVDYLRNQFCIAENTKFIIYDNIVYNHYNGEIMPSMFALMEFCKLSFPQAFYVLNYFVRRVNKTEMEEYINETYINAGAIKRPQAKFKVDASDFNAILQEDLLNSECNEIKANALKRVYAYLHNSRYINRDVISHFIKRRYIAMDSNNNISFLTYRDDNVIAVTKKSTITTSKFRQNFVAEPHTGFFYSSVKANELKSIYVFESCIDLMSYLSLVMMKKVDKPDKKTTCYISLNGANPRYLDKVLREHPTIENVYMCLDNDSVGISMTDSFIENTTLNAVSLQSSLREASLESVGYIKDWNDLLKYETIKENS